MDRQKTYYNSILSDLKPKYKFKPKVAALDQDGISQRDLSDLNFNIGVKSPRTKHAYLRRKKNDETKDIKQLVGNFFDKPVKGKRGVDNSFDTDRKFYINIKGDRSS